jgi:hypothetical protein
MMWMTGSSLGIARNAGGGRQMSTGIEVVWYGGQRGSWCHSLPEWLTAGYTHAERAILVDGAILVIKADWDKNIDHLNSYIAGTRWLMLIVTANEEGTFVTERVEHPNCKIWLQTPHRHQNCDVALPWGWTPGASIETHSKKDLDCSFAGQITHSRRWDMMAAFPELAKVNRKWEFHGSDGFAKGISQPEYYALLGRSRVVPCPSGPFTVDSFRVCEALQFGAVPIIDSESPTGWYRQYWQRVFGPGCPLKILDEWSEFPVLVEDILLHWTHTVAETRTWWGLYKENLRIKFRNDLKELGAL